MLERLLGGLGQVGRAEDPAEEGTRARVGRHVAHGEDGAGSAPQDLLGDGTEQQLLEAAAAVGADDQEVGGQGLRLFQDHSPGVALEHLGLDRERLRRGTAPPGRPWLRAACFRCAGSPRAGSG